MSEQYPERGTMAYEALTRGEKMVATKARIKAAKARLEAPGAVSGPLVEDVSTIDVGEPRNVSMADPFEPVPPAKRGRPKKQSENSTELQEEKVRDYLGMALVWLSSREGHEHWRRDDDELRMVTVPGTRCYNNLDAALREKLQKVSDPAALIFGCVVIFGPSIMMEMRNVTPTRSPSRHQRPTVQHQPDPPRQAGDWPAGGDFGPAAPMATNSAEPIPVPAGIPLHGI